MGLLSGGSFGQAGTPIPLVLSGGTGGTVQQVDGVSPYDTTVAIRFNTDGTIETGKQLNGGGINFTAAGNWITGGTPDNSYSVRCTNVSIINGPGDWGTTPVANDSWISLVDAVRLWSRNLTSSGTRTFSCTFEVRKTAGPPPTTGSTSWTFEIDNVV